MKDMSTPSTPDQIFTTTFFLERCDEPAAIRTNNLHVNLHIIAVF